MTVEDSRIERPSVYFIRTKEKVWEPNEELLKSAFIPESDQSDFPEIIEGKTRIYPLAETSFPGVLRRMTATQAGSWAISKCRQQKWEVSLDNIECCLSNLEMDY